MGERHHITIALTLEALFYSMSVLENHRSSLLGGLVLQVSKVVEVVGGFDAHVSQHGENTKSGELVVSGG